MMVSHSLHKTNLQTMEHVPHVTVELLAGMPRCIYTRIFTTQLHTCQPDLHYPVLTKYFHSANSDGDDVFSVRLGLLVLQLVCLFILFVFRFPRE